MTRFRYRVAGLLAVGSTLTACTGTEDCTTSALADRSTQELEVFDRWLEQHEVDGVVGETGWPGTDEGWQDVGRAYYDTAADRGIGVFAWAGAEQWPADYPLAVYRGSDPDRPALDEAGSQAEVVEQGAEEGELPTGVALADGSFGASVDEGADYSTADVGTYGRDYRYPSEASWDYLRGRGVRDVRLAFMWERVQRSLDAPLDAQELDRLRETLAHADAAGIRVWLDLHSYGRYATVRDGVRQVLLLGSPELPAASLADLWRRLARALSDEPAVAGYGIMNEPHDLPGGAPAWESASVAAVEAVREVDGDSPVLVGGYSYSRAGRFPELHPQAWVPEDLGPVLYEAHQYFDADGSGTYARGFEQEEAEAARQGFGC